MKLQPTGLSGGSRVLALPDSAIQFSLSDSRGARFMGHAHTPGRRVCVSM